MKNINKAMLASVSMMLGGPAADYRRPGDSVAGAVCIMLLTMRGAERPTCIDRMGVRAFPEST